MNDGLASKLLFNEKELRNAMVIVDHKCQRCELSKKSAKRERREIFGELNSPGQTIEGVGVYPVNLIVIQGQPSHLQGSILGRISKQCNYLMGLEIAYL